MGDKTLLIPDRPGNRLVYGHRNILANPHVGILFMIPGTPETLRVNGKAALTADPDLLGASPPAASRPFWPSGWRVEEVFFHCAKAFLRSRLWRPESWGERHRVSFGKMYAVAKKASPAGPKPSTRPSRRTIGTTSSYREPDPWFRSRAASRRFDGFGPGESK